MYYEFRTKVDICLIGDVGILGGNGEAVITWCLTAEILPEGIKCFGIYVPEQIINVDITSYNHEEDIETTKNCEFKLKDVSINETNNLGNITHLSVVPASLEVNGNKFELLF